MRPNTRWIRRKVLPHGHGSLDQFRQIPCTKPNDGECLFCESGDDQFAHLSRPNRLKRLGIDYFHNEMVLVHMEAVTFQAFSSHTGAHDLAETIVVGSDYLQSVLKFSAQGLTPGLGPKKTIL